MLSWFGWNAGRTARSRGIEGREQIRFGSGPAGPLRQAQVFRPFSAADTPDCTPACVPGIQHRLQVAPDCDLGWREAAALEIQDRSRSVFACTPAFARGAAHGIRDRWRIVLARAVACVPALRWEALTLLTSYPHPANRRRRRSAVPARTFAGLRSSATTGGPQRADNVSLWSPVSSCAGISPSPALVFVRETRDPWRSAPA